MLDRPIYDVAHAHYRDMLRAAQHDQLVHRVTARRGRNPRSLSRTLAWLGRYLVRWGSLLQERYDAVPATPALQCADRVRCR
jgi:hypothetical protein